MSSPDYILLVVAPFYADISVQLVTGAQRVLSDAGYQIESVSVPGALEIPGAIALAEQSGLFAGYVALGCVIRGETTHYETVCAESARGLMDLTLSQHLAVGNGIITVENMQQAQARANPEQKNKGGEAANACIRLLELQKKWNRGGAILDDSHNIKMANNE